jgi:pimeloyl-ACP methyl ester carboxylesterase
MKPPSRLLLLAESRAIVEVGLGLATAPLMRLAPRGDGHAVLVLPGFMASDRSTAHLREVLQRLGYAAHGWELGRNLGVVPNLRQALRTRLASLHDESAQKVSLVGWSLGGVLARDLALAMPEKVRRVVTLGSPFSGDLTASNVNALYNTVTPNRERVRPDASTLARLAGDLGVPATAIYSRTDGIVNWRTCLLTPNHHAENIEILGASHLALGFNPAAVWAVADRLSQADGHFSKFRRRGPFAGAYGALA